MKYNSLFIDLDDTLWDTSANMKESLEEIYHSYGLGKWFDSFDQFNSIYQTYNHQLWHRYHHGEIRKEYLAAERFRYPMAQVGIDIKNEDALEMNEKFLFNTTLKTKLVPHAIELLEHLKPNYKMYILSNGFQEVQYKKIANSGLASYFEKVLLSDDIGYNKPHQKIYEYALKSTNSRKESSLMIGDNFDTDITGARNFKMDQIYFRNGGEYPITFEPTYTVDNLLEIKEIL
ncbi:MAG: YjjG family noncanonical pyrimidine nucleotidase [Bacteroidales bacterium]